MLPFSFVSILIIKYSLLSSVEQKDNYFPAAFLSSLLDILPIFKTL